MATVAAVDVASATVEQCSSRRFMGFGEAMLRYAPTGKEAGLGKHGAGAPAHAATFWRSVGGDELNVMVRAGGTTMQAVRVKR